MTKNDTLRQIHWGMSGSDYPKHWSKLDTATRAKILETIYEETYRSDYPRLSWYIHAGATGFDNISAAGIESGFGWAHFRVQEFLYEATDDVCTTFRLFDASPGLRQELEKARLIPGESLVRALLAAKQKENAGSN